jgi:hypothetical protein
MEQRRSSIACTTVAVPTTAGQLVTSERGVCGGPLAFDYANLMSHTAFRQSLACVSLLFQSLPLHFLVDHVTGAHKVESHSCVGMLQSGVKCSHYNFIFQNKLVLGAGQAQKTMAWGLWGTLGFSSINLAPHTHLISHWLVLA